MKRKLLVLASVFVVLALLGSLYLNFVFLKDSYIQSQTPRISGEKLWTLVNNWRESKDLPVYDVNDRVCDIAKVRLSEMNNDFSHKGYERTGYILGALPYELGENLASGFNQEGDVLDGWLNSPLHLENLEKNYKYSCIATDGQFVVHTFANF